MKAIVFSAYGPPEVLRLEEVAQPTPRPDEVLLQVHAAGINDWDLGILRGETLLDRLLYGLFKPRRKILGCDVAGQVVAVGDQVTRFRPGDAVFGDLSGCGFGAFAEYVCARENALAPMPAGLSFPQAAAIPQAAQLAVQGLFEVGQLRPGQSLLINGAGGGVGTFALQLAHTLGVAVTAVDRADKLERLRALGAHQVLDYAREDFTRAGRHFDLILDVKTNRSPLAYTRALKPGGTYVTVGGDLRRLLQALLLRPWIGWAHGKRIRIVALKPNKDLATLTGHVEAGQLVPVIDGTYPLAALPEALRRFARADHLGKLVLTLRDDPGESVAGP